MWFRHCFADKLVHVVKRLQSPSRGKLYTFWYLEDDTFKFDGIKKTKFHTFIDAANGFVLLRTLGVHPRGVGVPEVDTPSFRSVGLVVAPVGVRPFLGKLRRLCR